MEENIIYYRTSTCNIKYHVVWSVKHRHKILDKEVEMYLNELVQQIANEKGFIIQLSITMIVKYLKGITGRKLLEQFPEIRDRLWHGELWNHSYYCETIGAVSEENIKQYIEHQSKSY